MVRIKVTLDCFSGRPNPSWEMPQDKVKEFFEMKGWKELMFPKEQEDHLGLGYRGFILSLISAESEKKRATTPENATERQIINFPDTFRIYGSNKITPDSIDLKPALEIENVQDREKWLLSTSRSSMMTLDHNTKTISKTKTDLSPKFIQSIEKDISASTVTSDTAATIEKQSEIIEGQSNLTKELLAKPEFVTQSYRPSFWNNPFGFHMNNCYNYASNIKTDNFAQPGWAHGRTFNSGDPASVIAAAESDGMSTNDTGNTSVVALVIDPRTPEFQDRSDYHFYTFHREGFWGHKPGMTLARNIDNSHRIIGGNLTPENCNRGSYTIFAGYFYMPLDAFIAGPGPNPFVTTEQLLDMLGENITPH
jgi:hypothetical protein